MRFTPGHRVAFFVALTALLLAAAGFTAVLRAARIQLTKLPIYPASGLTFPSLPSDAGDWTRFGPERPPLPADVLEQLGTDNYVARQYVRRDRARDDDRRVRLDLHCAYYTGTIDTVPHIPERCFVGGGLTQRGGAVTLPLPLDMSRLSPDPSVDPSQDGGVIYRARLEDGKRVRLPRGVENLQIRITSFVDGQGRIIHSGYFFIANGGVVASAERVRELAFHLSDTYAYYAKVQVTSADVASPEELAHNAADLLDDMLPYIMLRLPDWVAVSRRSGDDGDRSAKQAT